MTLVERDGPVTTRADSTSVIHPQNSARHAERVVLGAVLQDEAARVAVSAVVADAEDFELPVHRAIYAAVSAQQAIGAPVDPFIIAERLSLSGDLGRMPGGAAYLHTLMAECPVVQTAPYYARRVRAAAEGRQFVMAGHRLIQAGEADDLDVRAAIVADVREGLSGGTPRAAAVRLRDALVDSAGLDGIPEPEPLVEGIVYRDSLVWVIGPPGSAKSFVSLDMAGCISTGESWQGHRTRQGDVLYLVAEGVSGIRARVRAWEAAMSRTMGVRFLPVAVQAASDAEWNALVDLAVELRPAEIVIDTQARVTVGMDENAARDMGLFVHRVDRLRAQTEACVKIVHHQGRNGDHMRGSTALEGAATTIIKVAKADNNVTVSCQKQKDAEPFEDINLRLVPYESSAILALTAEAGRPQWNSPNVMRSLSEWWQAHESDWVSISTLVKSNVFAEATFHRYKKALIRDGVISTDGAKRFIRYRLERNPVAS
ncbi:AAA family ATPase [Dactylosporangium sp. NPDC005572]|uniref:AAA family ATPase n=1 Tax=Dactylosporangium sp. NPDC005572 TaxID=3156889 RepID=UPI0033B3A8CD